MQGETAGPEAHVDDGWLVAVGVPLGRWLDPSQGRTPADAVIRHGSRFAIVDVEALGVFLSAVTPTGSDALVAAARDRGVDSPDELVESMQNDGLLVRFIDDEETNLTALRGLRLQTVGVGLGNDDDDPEHFVIADHKLLPLLRCDGLTYMVWAASDGRSLHEVCHELAESYSMPVRAILRHFLHTMPELLAAGVAFLDTTPGDRSDA